MTHSRFFSQWNGLLGLRRRGIDPLQQHGRLVEVVFGFAEALLEAPEAAAIQLIAAHTQQIQIKRHHVRRGLRRRALRGLGAAPVIVAGLRLAASSTR